MGELINIKNTYAKSSGYGNWHALVEYYIYCGNEKLHYHIEKVMKMYAMECLKKVSKCNTIRMHAIPTDIIYNEDNLV